MTNKLSISLVFTLCATLLNVYVFARSDVSPERDSYSEYFEVESWIFGFKEAIFCKILDPWLMLWLNENYEFRK